MIPTKTPIFQGKYQLVWNSTSLDALKACPRRYQYSILQSWATSDENIHIKFGLAYHKAVELYHFARASNCSHDEAVIIAIRHAHRATWPDTLEPTKKSRINLLRAIVWYLDEFGVDDPIETLIRADGQPAVEVTFALELDIPSPLGENVPYVLAGHLDRVGKYMNDGYFTDLKTTGSALGEHYFSTYNPHNQMSTYSFAGKVITDMPMKGGIIDACQVMAHGVRFQRGFVHRTPEQLTEWYDDLRYWFGMAQSYATREYWPMNDTACRLCNFREICAKDPKVRNTFLRNFSQRVVNPLEVRT